MICLRIQGATHRLGAPKGWDDEKHGPCNALSVRLTEDGHFESAWEPTPEELRLLNAGQPVILSVVGGQPAVFLRVDAPAEEPT